MSNVEVTVWGHSGYAGQELIGILEQHPHVSGIQTVGRDMSSDMAGIEIAFLALPHGDSGRIARVLRKGDTTVIDLSGDFRFQTVGEYERWYGQEHPAPALLPAPYGLPELRHDELLGSKLVAVPGCYPTATLLGAVPLVQAGLIKSDTRVLVDAISGTSGMGKAKKAVADQIVAGGNVVPYSIGNTHRHVGEMEQFLDGREVFFSPAVGPYFRGLIAKVTAELVGGGDELAVQETLEAAYADEAFVGVLPAGEIPSVADTAGTNLCYIGAVVARKTVQIISSLDNLRKGAASQAVQVFNLIHGFPENSGLQGAAL